MVASVDSWSRSATSSLLFTLLSKYSHAKAAPSPNTSPAINPSVRLRGTFGLVACCGTSARSTMRMFEGASSELTVVSICCFRSESWRARAVSASFLTIS